MPTAGVWSLGVGECFALRGQRAIVTCHKPQSAIVDYAKRWGIETLFGCLKTRGFCLESTHLQDAERLGRMVALLTIASCWAFKTGE
jgi:hypothetical protein